MRVLLLETPMIRNVSKLIYTQKQLSISAHIICILHHYYIFTARPLELLLDWLVKCFIIHWLRRTIKYPEDFIIVFDETQLIFSWMTLAILIHFTAKPYQEFYYKKANKLICPFSYVHINIYSHILLCINHKIRIISHFKPYQYLTFVLICLL